MRVKCTYENGWITHGKICATCIRHSWRDHTKLEITPKNIVEIDMQCKEFIANLNHLVFVPHHRKFCILLERVFSTSVPPFEEFYSLFLAHVSLYSPILISQNLL
jgi:hypothetical protein